jgi:hypothetical protein
LDNEGCDQPRAVSRRKASEKKAAGTVKGAAAVWDLTDKTEGTNNMLLHELSGHITCITTVYNTRQFTIPSKLLLYTSFALTMTSMLSGGLDKLTRVEESDIAY